MESRKTVYIILFAKQKQRHKCKEQMCGHKAGKGRRINREIQVDLHTLGTMYKIDNQREPTGFHNENLWVAKTGEKATKRGDIAIRTADSLCCTAETNTTL